MDASSDDDTIALIRGCAVGDQAALGRLYERWSARLYGIALRITRQSSLAADATHDAFVQVWQQAGRFDPMRGSPGSWLISLARYRALDLVRRHGREPTVVDPPDQADDSPDPLAVLASTSEGDALHRCLGRLDGERRQIIQLAFVEGLSHSELAERLRTPLGTVKSWIRRSLLILRECLEQ